MNRGKMLVSNRQPRQRLTVPNWAAWAGSGALFLAISRLHQHITPLGRAQALAILSAVALIALFAHAGRWRPADLRKHWVPTSVGIILAIAVLGVPFGIYPGQSFDFITGAYIKTILIGLMVWAVSRTEAGARMMAKTIAAGGAVAAALAFFTGRSDSSGRLSGAYTYDPNDISLISLIAVPLIVWWALDKRNRFRWWVLLVLPILLQVIIKSDSRSGFLGLVAMVLGFFVLSLRKAPRKVKRVSQMLAIAAIVSVPFLPPGYMDRISSIGDEDDYNRTSPTGRVEVWKRGIGYAFDYPLFGVGIDNFNTAEGRLSDIAQARSSRGIGFKWSTAHNSFVQVLAELGLVGGGVFIVLILRLIWVLVRWNSSTGRRDREAEQDLLPPLVGLAFVGYAVTGFFLSFAYYDIVYALIGLAGGILMPLHGRAGSGERFNRPRTQLSRSSRYPRTNTPVPGFDRVRRG